MGSRVVARSATLGLELGILGETVDIWSATCCGGIEADLHNYHNNLSSNNDDAKEDST
jgi:hypothetical protein